MMAELDILNGFAGKVISDCIDISINAIKKADKNRKSKNQTIETRIYQVTIDALNVFPYNKYKKEEKVYDAAENMLKELKRGNRDYKEAVRFGLSMLSVEITGDICEVFLGLLCDEIRREENRDIAIGYIIHQGEEVIYLQKETNKYMKQGFEKSYQNEEEILGEVSNIKEDMQDIKENLNRQKNYKIEGNRERSIENKAQYYADKWNKNVFLNNYDEEDERAGDRINVKLKDIYLENLLPCYKLNRNIGISYNLKERLKRYIVDKNDREMFLILGQPGIGKSTLITWVMANLVEKRDEIFVYQFASDLKNVNWQEEDILEEIFKSLWLKNEELKDKVLILDGFDEISISGDRERILNKLYQELEKMNCLGKFSLIITCRENYVNCSNLKVKDYITLQAWSKEQIKIFCEIYEKESSGNFEAEFSETKINEILKNKEIFGIPLILYMVLALNVDIEKSSSMVEIYDQIFSVERGSIYDRCYDVEHRINSLEIKKYIHQISQRIAFWIFENNSEKASILQKEFRKICDNVINNAGERNEDLQRDVLIGNYFTAIKHCEGTETDELQFVHRSIYEYFVAVYFSESICKLTFKEDIAGKLGELLKDGHLSKQILEFIKYKFVGMEEKYLLDIAREIFDMMLHDGMTYYFIKELNQPLLDIIVREINIFSNMLEIIHLWHDKMECVDKKIVVYLQHNRRNKLNLSGLNLSGADLEETDLNEADLSRANLGRANLRKADLNETDLSRANLRKADLIKANLRRAYLSRADLGEACLGMADLGGADLSEAGLRGAILGGADLSGVNLRKADLFKADLRRVILGGANLSGANLSGANLSGADLSEANLSGADLSGANLSGADLSGANLNEADLFCSNLSGANLNGTLINEERVSILDERYDLSKCRILLSEEDEIISWHEYSINK